MNADRPYKEPTECWVCNQESAKVDEWATWALNELSEYVFETYQVGTRVPPLIEENDILLREDAGLPEECGEPFKREINREVGKRIGQSIDASVDFSRPDIVVMIDIAGDRVTVQSNSAFVYGRYKKLSRGIPQTEWPCRECDGNGTVAGDDCSHCDGSGYLYEESVEELIAPSIQSAMNGAGSTFHGAGREDVDAKMLGTGRPFVVEVSSPKDRFPDVSTLTDTVNARGQGKVAVSDLALATYEMVERVKELPAKKTYNATVRFAKPVDTASFNRALSALEGETIEQQTPTRVTHRRADRVRTRTVYEIDGELETETTAQIRVEGEGGLYIKELMTGDNGRTKPSITGELGVDCEVTALDVVAVTAEDGEFADPAFLREQPTASSKE
jgi:tRNA pseudouridine synthase 10